MRSSEALDPRQEKLPLEVDHQSCPQSTLEEIRGDDHGFLRSMRPFGGVSGESANISIVDLFCGVGGLSLGFHEAAHQLGDLVHSELAVDNDVQAAACYADNFSASEVFTGDVREYFKPDFGASLATRERDLRSRRKAFCFLIGGPPCQGHSDLNNSTRRKDPKNSLYFSMARAAQVLEADAVVIENVPMVIHDRSGVVQRTKDALMSLGYRLTEHVFDMSKMGVPQKRKRHILIACTKDVSERMSALESATTPVRGLDWAIGDLESLNDRKSILDQVAVSSKDTKRRIQYLFENELYDLPDSERPKCHRDKPHSYKSIYGRLSWNEPAQTITRGFYSMCMGRYVHPSEKRTLTAHEAARIQFFPDYFNFQAAASRTKLATMIGNAVPSKIGYLIAMQLYDALGVSS